MRVIRILTYLKGCLRIKWECAREVPRLRLGAWYAFRSDGYQSVWENNLLEAPQI